MPKLKVGIQGGAGFTGGELLRLLSGHPRVELAAVASSSHAGEPVHRAHPQLRGLSDLKFSSRLPLDELDCVFLASGHGEAMGALPELLSDGKKGIRIIDLSGDFRLKDAALYPAWYGREHSAPKLLKDFAYGLTELNRKAVESARLIANPGCIATAAALALGPLARAGLKGTAKVTAVTGSSGSGVKPSETTHHPLREGNMRAYKPLRHQHAPEVEQLLGMGVALVAVSGPYVRGIYCVAHAEIPSGKRSVKGIFEKAYGDCPFIRLMDSPPDVKSVAGSNFCDIYATAQGRQAVVIAALDNLVKGAAGQAVQNLNVMMGWEETAGLLSPGIYP